MPTMTMPMMMTENMQSSKSNKLTGRKQRRHKVEKLVMRGTAQLGMQQKKVMPMTTLTIQMMVEMPTRNNLRMMDERKSRTKTKAGLNQGVLTHSVIVTHESQQFQLQMTTTTKLITVSVSNESMLQKKSTPRLNFGSKPCEVMFHLRIRSIRR